MLIISSYQDGACITSQENGGSLEPAEASYAHQGIIVQSVQKEARCYGGERLRFCLGYSPVSHHYYFIVIYHFIKDFSPHPQHKIQLQQWIN